MTMGSNQARSHLLEFRQRVYGIDAAGHQRSEFKEISEQLHNAAERLSTDLYDEDLHFVFELIQNAEDNSYEDSIPELRFVLLEDDPTNTSGAFGCLCVLNNETGFEPKNVESIASIGKSTKTKASGYIGEKGIGFKSVFVVTASPHIFSGGYQFRFMESDTTVGLGYVVPYWVESVPEIVRSSTQATSLLLPLKPDKASLLRSELALIEPETILFLSKLDRIAVSVGPTLPERETLRSRRNGNIVELRVTDDGVVKHEQSYFVSHETVVVPPTMAEEKRQDVHERVISAAFPLEDECDGRVFAFLPTEVYTGLPFLLNADFLLTSSRESIQTGRTWNTWLRDQLSRPVLAALEQMRLDENFRFDWYKFIPAEARKKPSDFFQPVRDAIRASLEKQACVLDWDEDFQLPKACRLVKNRLRKLLAPLPRPRYLDEVKIVHSKIGRYDNQLRKLGVKRFNFRDLKKCLEDDAWTSTKSADWFVALYSELSGRERVDASALRQLPIVLTQSNEVFRRDDTAIFIPGSTRSHARFAERINALEFPQVQLLHTDLVNALEDDPALRSWVVSALSLNVFSIGAYVSEQLIPWLNNDAEEHGPTRIIDALALVTEFWSELDERSKASLKRMPVVLADGAIVGDHRYPKNHLVVPRQFERNGWHLFFASKEDCAHLAVLNPAYNKFKLPDGLSRWEVLSSLGATRHPAPPAIEVRRQEHRNVHPDIARYIDQRWAEFSERTTSTPRLSTTIAPSIISDGNRLQDTRRAKSLIAWLEHYIDNDAFEVDLRYGQIRYFYRTSYFYTFDSAFYLALRSNPWLPTTKGPKRPGEAFRESSQIRELIGNRVPYAKTELSDSLCAFLGVHVELTTASVIDYLAELAASKAEPDIATVARLYKHLDSYGDCSPATFGQKPIAYAPGPKQSWWPISAVIWEDQSAALPDVYGYLSNTYEAHRLKDFFTKKLGVSTTVSNAELLKTWRALPKRRDLEPDGVEQALGAIVPTLSLALQEEGTRARWWRFPPDRPKVWTEAKSFSAPDAAYIPDNLRLRNLFAKRVDFVWTPERGRLRNYDLYGQLGVRRLSEAAIPKLNLGSDTTLRPARILTPLSKELLGYVLWNADEQLYEALVSAGTLRSLAQVSEATSDSLSISYRLTDNHGRTVTRETEVESHLDLGACKLYVSSSAESNSPDSLKDDVADCIARTIWPHHFGRHRDSILVLLGLTSRERLRRLRDRRNLSMPVDRRKQLLQWVSETDEEVSAAPIGAPKSQHEPDTSSSPPPNGPSVAEPGGEETTHGTSQGGSDDTPGLNLSAGTRIEIPAHFEPQPRSRGKPTHATPKVNVGEKPRTSYGRSKSRSVTQALNRKLQRRIVTYVENTGTEAEHLQRGESDARRATATGTRGEEFAMQFERSAKRVPRRMPPLHPGYDIESHDPESGELRLIEVKSMEGPWGIRGVGITRRQFEVAREKGQAYWLYVYENVLDDTARKLHLIQDPAGKITYFGFDEHWRHIGESSPSHQPAPSQENDGIALTTLQELTDDATCRAVLARCFDAGLPLPEVGFELVNSQDSVIAEAELAWEDEQVVVLLPELSTPAKNVFAEHGWIVLQAHSNDDTFVLIEKHIKGSLQ